MRELPVFPAVVLKITHVWIFAGSTPILTPVYLFILFGHLPILSIGEPGYKCANGIVKRKRAGILYFSYIPVFS